MGGACFNVETTFAGDDLAIVTACSSDSELSSEESSSEGETVFRG